MTKSSNEINITQARSKSYIQLVIWTVVFFVLLLLRDAYSVSINKNIFIVIICVCAVTLKIDHFIYLYCFLFSLYVGLPGNYMTFILIGRLLISTFKCKKSSLAISILISLYILSQNMIKEYTGIVPMMFIAGVVAVLLIFSHKDDLDLFSLILFYSAGVAATGYIMLTSTLNVYEFDDLMSISFRLGSGAVHYVESGTMNVNIDPNFYGTAAIASISFIFPMLLENRQKSLTKLCLYVFLIIQLVVCLIGLSRAFLVVFALWIILYLLSQKNFKGAIIALVSIFLIIALVAVFIPDAVEALLERFNDEDMATANGRFSLIVKFFNRWRSSWITVIFGVGLYDCNVHCMPLQFLFGGGVILFSMVIALVISYNNTKRTKSTFSESLPFIVTLLMMCTVPAAGLINSMFPLVFVGLVMRDSQIDSGELEII